MKPKYINEPQLIELYNEGISVLQMSHIMNISRTTLKRRIEKLGLTPRSGSEANFLRFGRMTKEERKELTKKCNEKMRNRKYTQEELRELANKRSGKSCSNGFFEYELALILMELGYKVEIQKSCNTFQIDMVVNDKYAIEIGANMSYSTHKHANEIDEHRLNCIYNDGYKLIAINFSNIAAIILGFNKLLPLLQECLSNDMNYLLDINYIQIKGFNQGKGLSIKRNIIDNYFNILDSSEERVVLVPGKDRNGCEIKI